MNVEQVKRFYEWKEDVPCPITERLLESGYQQRSGGYIKYAHECSITKPTQWWHLIKSYCDRSDPNRKFTKQIQCGELLVWMAEVSMCMCKSELNELVDEVLKNKQDRRSGNKLIKDKCFDKIVEMVEASTCVNKKP